jgi:hypothetical protein
MKFIKGIDFISNFSELYCDGLRLIRLMRRLPFLVGGFLAEPTTPNANAWLE